MYQQLIYPERAEDLKYNEFIKDNYKIFLDHWEDNIKFLKNSYEKVFSNNGISYALVIYGAQGVGKTILASKLYNDYEITLKNIKGKSLNYDEENIWHLITCGHDKSVSKVTEATEKTRLMKFNGEENWIEEIEVGDHTNVVIIDNAETANFGSVLTNLNGIEYMAQRYTPHVAHYAAQQFVYLAREKIRGTLFIILGNEEEYLKSFVDSCEKHHKGMVKYHELDLPIAENKEKIVRTNINRLNSASYWSLLDKGTVEVKENLYDKLKDASNFPEVFNVVNEALSKHMPRVGRRANKCILSFVLCINNFNKAHDIASYLAGKSLETSDFDNDVVKIYTLTDSYCQRVIGDTRSSQMLESEFSMQLIILSETWFSKLLGDEEAKNKAIDFLKSIVQFNGSREKRTKACDKLLNSGIGIEREELDKFWRSGATRANKYEALLKNHFDKYNTVFSKSTNKRPDILISEYVPCSILSAVGKDNIKDCIKRTCHAIEITSIKDADSVKVKDYLKKKLPNYIELIMES